MEETRHSPCLSLSSKFQFPAKLWIVQTSQLYSFVGTRGPHSCDTTSPPPTAPGHLLCSQGQPPHGHGMQRPPPPGWEYMWLIHCRLPHLSGVERVCLDITVPYGVNLPSSASEAKRRQLKQSTAMNSYMKLQKASGSSLFLWFPPSSHKNHRLWDASKSLKF